MFAQVIRRLVDLANIHPNERAALHEQINVEVAQAALATPPEEPPPAAPLAAVPDLPPEAPPAAA